MLQFVSQSDNIQSCRFAQTMEQRLQKAFQDAERKVLNTKSNLTIQVTLPVWLTEAKHNANVGKK